VLALATDRTFDLTSSSLDDRVVTLKYFSAKPNVGDLFSLELAARWFQRSIKPAGQDACDGANLVLLGSILQWADAHSVVCGAGLIRPDIHLRVPPRAVISVRGPLTADALKAQNLDPGSLFGDPGLLAPDLYPSEPEHGGGVVIVPHYVDLDHPWLDQARAEGATVLSPVQSPGAFFEVLKRADIVLSSSLHGVVFAHAFGKPALWLELSDKVLGKGFKFRDYYASLGVEPDRADLNEAVSLKGLAERACWRDPSSLQEQVREALTLSEAHLSLC
jgi:pyruvyltransferase